MSLETVSSNYLPLVSLTACRDVSLLRTGLLASILQVVGSRPLRLYRSNEDENNNKTWNILEFYTSYEDAVQHHPRGDFELLVKESVRENDLTILEEVAERDNSSIFLLSHALTLCVLTDSDATSSETVIVLEGKVKTAQLATIQALVVSYINLQEILYRSTRDVLTGLSNRQVFDDRMAFLLADQSVPEDNFGCLAYLDIDFFKRVNDNWGHLYGDEVLVVFSRLMNESFRDDDWLFRIGGEEFVAVLRNSSEQHAFEALERFRKSVEAYDFPQVGKVTVSIGYVKLSQSVPLVKLVEAADKALYHAKENGRNQSVSYEKIFGDINEHESYDEDDDDVELF